MIGIGLGLGIVASSGQRGVGDRMRAVADAPTEDFAALLKVAGLNPSLHLRFQEWSRSSFALCDLAGCDFTGARLLGCDFSGSVIAGARFDGAIIEQVGIETPLTTDLRRAADWDGYVKRWRQPDRPASDAHLPVGAVFRDAPFGPELVVVPPGSFMMGGRFDLPPYSDAVWPKHEVTIPQALAVGRFAVSVDEWNFAQADEQWRDITGLESQFHHMELGDAAVEGVTWQAAQRYAKWLSTKTGRSYRLLSESEWEYCWRVGTNMRFWRNPDTTAQSPGDAPPVRIFQQNPWGISNLGALSEWVEDVWHETYDGAPDDGTPWISGILYIRVVRGGTMHTWPDGEATILRSHGDWEKRYLSFGFRLSRALNL